MIITMDGPSGTGKSTLAKLLAKKLGYKLLNTGMIYRTMTHYLLKEGIMPNQTEIIDNISKKLQVEVKFDGDNQLVYICGEDCTPFINDSNVQKEVSNYSSIQSLREVAIKIQREFASKYNIVVEGRDIGTEVFPNAEHKFYVVCDINVRAQRRLIDLKKVNPNITLEEVIKSLENRDYLDSTRKISPLKRADDAVLIDTSNETIEESLNEILSYL